VTNLRVEVRMTGPPSRAAGEERANALCSDEAETIKLKYTRIA